MANHEATLIGLLRKAAQSYPEKRAISFAGKFVISHSRLQELVDYSASVLQSAGVSTGDFVALTIPNSIEALNAKYGAITIIFPRRMHYDVSRSSTQPLNHVFINANSLSSIKLPASGSILYCERNTIVVLRSSLLSFFQEKNTARLHTMANHEATLIGSVRGSVTLPVCHEPINNEATSGNTDSPISAPAAAVDIALDMVDSLLNNMDPTLGFEISPSEGPGQNTGSPGGGLGPNQTNWIRWSMALDAFNFVSDAMLGVTVNLPNLFMNRSNSIRQLVVLAGVNLSSNTLIAVNYLYGEAQEAQEINWRALIASVGPTIAVSVFTLLSSFRFASDRERWSKWIAQLSRLNAAMLGTGPFAYWMTNRGTEN